MTICKHKQDLIDNPSTSERVCSLRERLDSCTSSCSRYIAGVESVHPIVEMAPEVMAPEVMAPEVNVSGLTLEDVAFLNKPGPTIDKIQFMLDRISFKLTYVLTSAEIKEIRKLEQKILKFNVKLDKVKAMAEKSKAYGKSKEPLEQLLSVVCECECDTLTLACAEYVLVCINLFVATESIKTNHTVQYVAPIKPAIEFVKSEPVVVKQPEPVYTKQVDKQWDFTGDWLDDGEESILDGIDWTVPPPKKTMLGTVKGWFS